MTISLVGDIVDPITQVTKTSQEFGCMKMLFTLAQNTNPILISEFLK